MQQTTNTMLVQELLIARKENVRSTNRGPPYMIPSDDKVKEYGVGMSPSGTREERPPAKQSMQRPAAASSATPHWTPSPDAAQTAPQIPPASAQNSQSTPLPGT